MTYYDRGYGRPSGRPRVFLRQAQDRLPLQRIPRSAGWHAHLRSLATAIHETSGLEEWPTQFTVHRLLFTIALCEYTLKVRNKYDN
jgi:hypothetical protein